MKMNKLLSVVLSIAMLISMVPFTFTASAGGPVSTYYAMFGGTGDGRSKDAPAGSMAAIVSAVNTDGWTTGDNVTVVVIDREDALAPVNKGAHNMLSWGSTDEFAATLTITSPEGTTSHLVNSPEFKQANVYPVLAGDVIFDNIMLVMNRKYDSSFCAAGRNVSITENTTFGQIKDDTGNFDGTLQDYAFILQLMRAAVDGTPGEGGTLKLNITNGKNLDLRVGYRENKNYANDFNVYVENAPSVSLGATQAGGFQATFGKNLNFILGSSVKKFTVNGTGSNVHSAAVNGSVQVIAGKDTEVNDISANLTIAGKVYVVKTADPSLLDITSTAGTFKVANGKKAFAIAEDGLSVAFNSADTITLDAGETTVIFADSFEDLGLADPSPRSGQTFKGWEIEGNKYVAKFDGETVDTDKYYVSYGATGDGRSVENPAGTIRDVVNNINADGWTAGDKVTVYVIDAEDALTYRPVSQGRGATAHHMLGWSAPAKHAATITFTSLPGTTAHLCTSQTFGGTDMMCLMGDVVFDNIMLVMTRQYDASLETCGYNCTLKPTVTYGRLAEFGSGGETWDGTFINYNFIVKGGRNGGGDAKNLGAGGTTTIDLNNRSAIDFRVLGYREGGTYTDDVTFIIKNTKSVTMSVSDINQTKFNKNLNLIFVNSGNIATSFANVAAKVDGAVQVIKNASVTMDTKYQEGFVAAKGHYIMNVNEDGILTPTETAGKFAVAEGKTLLAVDESTGAASASADGFLTVDPGTYTVSTFEGNLESLKISASFDGVVSKTLYLKGYSLVLPVLENTLTKEFIGWKYDGKFYTGGETFTIPADATGTLAFVSNWADFGEFAYCYVDQTNGSDDNNGSTPKTAYKSLETAFAAIDGRSGYDVKKVIIIGTYLLPGALPKHSSMITICGEDAAHSADFHFAANNGGSMELNGPTTFENLTLTRDTNWKFINTTDNELVFGEGMTLVNVNIHFGHENGKDSGFQKLTVKSGTVSALYVGSHYVTYDAGYAGCDVIVDGGSIGTVSFGSDAYMDTHKGTIFSGNCNFYIYGGSIGSFGFKTGATAPQFKAGINVFYFNGTTGAAPVQDNCYVIKDATDGKGDHIVGTSELGVFDVVSEKGLTAIASCDSGKYASTDGKLTLPAGTYDISFTDKLFYLNNGETIEVYEDCTLDLSKEAHKSYEDKIFLGWATKNDKGEYVGLESKSLIPGGTTVYAVFADYDAFDKYNIDEDATEDGDFYIYGVQMRLASEDKPQGLRFITELKGDFLKALPGVTEYGSAIYPSDKVMGRDMLLEPKTVVCSDGTSSLTRYLYTSDVLPSLVPAVNIYEDLPDGGVRYTVCVTGITEQKYDRFYTVKGYLKWVDYQGEEHVLLTDYYECNLYKTALAALNDTSASYTTEQLDSIKAVKDYVENDKRLAYFRENYDSNATIDKNGDLVLADPKNADKITLLSGYEGVEWNFHGGPSDQYQVKAATSGKEDDRYKLYQLNNGLRVHEVKIDSGKSSLSDDTIDIIQFADTHFNYLNVRDFEEKNPALMSTAIYRTWNASSNGSASVTQGLNAVNYANNFDKAIVCGDMIDYLSWGSADMTKAILFDRLYRGTFVLGNHEPTRNMQGKVADPYAGNVHDVLQHIWTTDIYYHSEILSDANDVEKVMCVSLYDASYIFYDVQVNKLKADIDICREKGIPMLIFCHVPISTNGNPDNDTSKKVLAFYEFGDSSNLPNDFPSKYGRLGPNGDTASKAVFDLIANNADVVKGVFNGDAHSSMYTEIYASYPDGKGGKVEYDKDGKHIVIPQHTVTANAYKGGEVIRITVK